MRDPELELRLDVGRLTLGCIDEREDGHVSGIPAVHGFATNLALGTTPLLKTTDKLSSSNIRSGNRDI